MSGLETNQYQSKPKIDTLKLMDSYTRVASIKDIDPFVLQAFNDLTMNTIKGVIQSKSDNFMFFWSDLKTESANTKNVSHVPFYEEVSLDIL